MKTRKWILNSGLLCGLAIAPTSAEPYIKKVIGLEVDDSPAEIQVQVKPVPVDPVKIQVAVDDLLEAEPGGGAGESEEPDRKKYLYALRTYSADVQKLQKELADLNAATEQRRRERALPCPRLKVRLSAPMFAGLMRVETVRRAH